MSLDVEAIAAEPARADLYSTWRRVLASPWVRVGALAVYVAVFVWSARRNGLPVDRVAVVAWLLGAVVAGNVGRPWRTQLRMVGSWSLLAGMLFAYDYSRGIADELNRPVHVDGPRDIDRVLFFGADPTVWMQRQFYEADAVRWYDVAGSLVYMTHFVFPVMLPVYVLLRNGWGQFVRYMRRFATVLFAGVATYILYPAAPPWMADDQYGALGSLERITGRGWRHVGMTTVYQVFDRGKAITNPVAAMPSLHAAFALMVVLWFFPGRSWWVRALLLTFPLSMATTLVYFGEHYVSDVLAGWLYVLASFGFWSWWERRHPLPGLAPAATLDPADTGAAR
jgi:membrane-associated phospholipid phosphatase